MSDVEPAGYAKDDESPVQPESPGFVPAEKPTKPDIDVGFLLLGFLAPLVVLAPVLVAFSFPDAPLGGRVAESLPCLIPVHLVGSIVLFAVGRSKKNARLRSLGIGGLALYGLAVLAALLLTGTCLIGLGQSGQ